MNNKILIITNGNYFSRLILSKTLEKYHDTVSSIVIVTGDYKGRSGIRSLLEIFKVTAFPYFFYKAFQGILFIVIGKLFSNKIFNVERLASLYGIPVKKCVSVKEEKIINWVSVQAPDLIVSVSCPQLIGKKILSNTRLGGINIHSSLLPGFAGLAPYFWVLSKDQKVTGTTVHYMSLRFDEGNILVQKQFEIKPRESAFHLFKSLAVVGNNALSEAVPLALSGFPGAIQNHENYSYFSHPTNEGYQSLRKNGYVLCRLKELTETIAEEFRNKNPLTNPELYADTKKS